MEKSTVSEQGNGKDAPASAADIISLIKAIVNDSNYPHRYVTASIAFLDALLSQAKVQSEMKDHA